MLGLCPHCHILKHLQSDWDKISSTLTTLFRSFLGMFAIRAERDFVIEEDFLKAVRKVADNKKLETKLEYKPV